MPFSDSASGPLIDDRTGAVIHAGARFGCERPSTRLAWMVGRDVLIPARCGAPNKCAYCAYLTAVENALLVSVDAERRGHPTVGMTLTTVDPQYDASAFRRAMQRTVESLRAIGGPGLAYLAMMEWTTGKGARSGGHRRAHAHVLVRGLDHARVGEAEARVARVWGRQTGASRVEVRELRTPAGATAYLVLHHRKREQAPPPGLRVTRFRPSRNYFDGPVGERRAEARAMMADKRLRRAAWRAVNWEEMDGYPEDLVEAELSAAVAAARTAAAGVCLVRLDRYGRVEGLARRRAA